MKNFFIIAVVSMMFTACNNDSNDNVLPLNTVEGKWLWSPTENRADANTMYEFIDGNKYKSYANCWPELCTDADWNALDSSDRIPGVQAYTFDENTLTIDDTLDVVIFECDGGIMYFSNGAKFWRLSSDCN
tara:strand:+ start:269 stop:661 length:393 start_codon:yes stop_codon:yes gene_type:complete